MQTLQNPYKPGAGHSPPFLAGRDQEKRDFQKLLGQTTILENVILTGLRGTGKTVLLTDAFKPLALSSGWSWCSADLTETASISDEKLALRILTDLSTITSSIPIAVHGTQEAGFTGASGSTVERLDFQRLTWFFERTPGLTSDKLRATLEWVWEIFRNTGGKGIVFAYDEAQNLSDHAERDAFPLSQLLDVFQSIQRKSIPFMLVLTGLPTLFPKLVEARTYAERMFHVITIGSLSQDQCRQAILEPIKTAASPIQLDEPSTESIIELSGGYPYFIQFICREVFDAFLQQINLHQHPAVPVSSIIQKLDTDFFAGRWNRATDRQRDLLRVIASLDTCDSEFTVQEVAEKSKTFAKPFSNSHINQMLAALTAHGLVYKNRHGKYSFAVPMLGDYIRRNAG